MKHDNYLKLMAVKRYLAGGIVYRDLAAELGISRSVLQRWVAWYQAHGCFEPVASAESHTAEFKLSALQHMWDNRLSYAQATVYFKIEGHNTLRQWARQFLQDGVTGLMPAPTRPPPRMTIPTIKPEPKSNDQLTQKELLDQIAYLQMENAYLKKLQALVQSQGSKAPGKKRK